jgi:hypothetical protein
MQQAVFKTRSLSFLAIPIFLISASTASAQGLEELLELTIGVDARDAIDAGEFDSFIRNDCTACQQQTEIIDRISIGLKLFLGLEGSDFELFEPGAGMQPIDEKEIERADGGNGADWSNGIAASADSLFVASMRGMHVFSLEDPASPVEVGFLSGYGQVRDIAVSGDIAFLADGKGITVVDVRVPAMPVEIGRINVGKRVDEIELSEKNDRLYVLTPLEVIRYNTMSNPMEPVEKDAVRVRGPTYRGMRLDGNWIYLGGNRTESIYDDRKSGMTLMGEHDVGDWVQGRIVRDGQAERVRYGSRSSFEVWGED